MFRLIILSLIWYRQNLDFEHLLNSLSFAFKNKLSFMYFGTPFGPCLFVEVIMNEFLFYVSRASDFGLMKIDDTGKVISFSEKPKGEELKAMVSWTLFFSIPSY